MAATLNYLLEANLGLVLILAFYFLFLRKETNFTMMRIYLLGSTLAAIVFPLIDLQLGTSAAPISIGEMIPSYWLPEVVVGGHATSVRDTTFDLWKLIGLLYITGVVVGLSIVLFQLIQLWRLIRSSVTYQRDGVSIVESNDNKPTFSFFNFIFIGNAAALSPQEKEQIILHESVHAVQRHSFDVLLINVLKIFFWFNPFINIYKKIFIQLHEFEADARAVENRDVDNYCSLLARVALQSADYSMANHFNHSLTVKRIEMMRTIKSNIRRWKVVALTATLPLLFFFIACNDQVGENVMEITKNSSHALIIPEPIQQRFEQLQKENPGRNYAVLELNETASKKINDLQSTYGLPNSIEYFKTKDGKVIERGVDGKVHKVHEVPVDPNDGQVFLIMEFTEEAQNIAEASAAQNDKVFTVVQQQPVYPGGFDPMVQFIAANLRYPTEARTQGLEGTVYVSFIVEKDGTVTNTIVVRGVEASMDQEAKRVVEMFPKWEPGKQDGQPVRVKFVLPIKFSLG
ncbi:MAG TPA: TonB family protein [Chryseosolibacter sp.]|nr:TonB family protein [Chryseosolibacter sp.]